MKVKRLIAMILALCLVFGAAPVQAFAADTTYPEIKVGEAITLTTSTKRTVYQFVPEKTGGYIFTSAGNVDPYAYLMESDLETEIGYNDDNEDLNFRVGGYLTAGQVYYLVLGNYTSWSGSYTVTVSEAEPATGMTMDVGDTYSGYITSRGAFSVSPVPETSVAEPMTWVSSDTGVLSFDEEGIATFHKLGTATVTGTSVNGHVVTCEVTVIPPDDTMTLGVSKSVELEKDENVGISFTPATSGDYVFYCDMSNSWYSGSVASGDDKNYTLENYDEETGVYSNIHYMECSMVAGTTYVLQLRGYESCTAVVGVEPLVTATALRLSDTEVKGVPGSGGYLQVQVTPEFSTAGELTWSVSDPSVLEIYSDDRYCEFQMLKMGTAVVTVTSETGLSASCTVTVEGASTVLTLNQEQTVSLPYRESKYFSFTPAESGTYVFCRKTGGEYFELGMVDGYDDRYYVDGYSGARKRMEAGQEYYLYAINTDSTEDITGTVVIKKLGQAEKLVLSQTTLTGMPNTEHELYLGISPDFTTAGTITWTVADTSVAKIVRSSSDTCYLQLGSGGTTTVTATGATGISASCTVTVGEPAVIALDTPTAVDIDDAGEEVFFKFVPDEDGLYAFSSTGDYDTYGSLYDSELEEIARDDDSGEGVNFSVMHMLVAGQTYYFSTRMLSSDNTGSYTVTLTATEVSGELTLDKGTTASLPYTQTKYFSFTAPQAGTYVFYHDTEGYIEFSVLGGYASDYSSESYRGYIKKLAAGETCYVSAMNSEDEQTLQKELFVKKTGQPTAITFSQTQVSTMVGGYVYLNMLYTPEFSYSDNVRWSSSDPSVVSFEWYDNSGCGLTCESPGEAVITATVGGLTATATVTVKGADYALVLDAEQERTLAAEQSLMFSFTAEEAGTYILYYETDYNVFNKDLNAVDLWESYESGNYHGYVATLSEGQTCYFTLENYSLTEETVNVGAVKAKAAESIRFSEAKLESYARRYVRVSVATQPEPSLSGELEWTSSDTDVVTVNGQEDGTAVLGLWKVGTATVTVTNDTGLSATLQVTVKDYPIIQPGVETSANIVSGVDEFFRFVPEKTGIYTFTSLASEDTDTYGNIYNANMGIVESNDDGGEYNNFRIKTLLLEGQTYYFAAGVYSGNATGSFPVLLELEEFVELTPDAPKTVTHQPQEELLWSFKPETGGTYKIYSQGVDGEYLDVKCEVLDADFNVIAEDDDSAEYNQFYIECELEAGQTYYLKTYSYGSEAQSVCVTVESEVAATRFDIPGVTMSLGNDLAMYFYVPVANVADGYYAEVTKTYADGRADVVETVILADCAKQTMYGAEYYLVAFDGIAAKEMTDELYCIVYNADGEQVSNQKTTSVETYALGMLDATTNAELQTVLADMLNYGAQAQSSFTYNTSDLANADMTQTHKGYATAQIDMSALNAHVVKGAGWAARSLTLKSNIQMTVFFDTSVVTKSATAKISYTNHNGNPVSYEIPGSSFQVYDATHVYLNIETLVAADIETVVYIDIYDGDTVVSRSEYNMAEYCKAQSTDPMLIALAKFCTAAYAYFH